MIFFKNSGEILIDDEIQSLALRNLWKTLCIDSIKLSDLEFIEVEVPKKKKLTPTINNSAPRAPQQAMTITPQPIINNYSQNNRENPQQRDSNPRPMARQVPQQPPLHKLQVRKIQMGHPL